MSATICIISAPEDHIKAATMKRHMTMMVRNNLIAFTEDVNAAHIVCVLLSNDLLNHEKSWADSETAKRRLKAGNCRVIPILVEPMAEFPEHLAMLSALPRHGKPANTDTDWANIAGELRAVAMKAVS